MNDANTNLFALKWILPALNLNLSVVASTHRNILNMFSLNLFSYIFRRIMGITCLWLRPSQSKKRQPSGKPFPTVNHLSTISSLIESEKQNWFPDEVINHNYYHNSFAHKVLKMKNSFRWCNLSFSFTFSIWILFLYFPRNITFIVFDLFSFLSHSRRVDD